MIIVNNFVHCIKNYAVFRGRATRSEYWLFVVASMILSFCAVVAGLVFDIAFETDGFFVNIWSSLLQLFLFLPSISVMVRRFHDTGHSGWWFWICLIPIVGLILILISLFSDSDPDANEYGANPKINAPLEDVSFVPNNNSANVQESVRNAQNQGKIVRVFNDEVSVGMDDGTFFVISVKELDFMPMVGDIVYVFSNGDTKMISKTLLF